MQVEREVCLSPRMPLTRAFSRESLHSPKQESLMQANLFLKYVTDCDISLMTDPYKVLCISLRKKATISRRKGKGITCISQLS